MIRSPWPGAQPLPSILLSSAFDTCIFSPSDLHLWQGNCSGAGFSASGQGDMVSLSHSWAPCLSFWWPGRGWGLFGPCGLCPEAGPQVTLVAASLMPATSSPLCASGGLRSLHVKSCPESDLLGSPGPLVYPVPVEFPREGSSGVRPGGPPARVSAFPAASASITAQGPRSLPGLGCFSVVAAPYSSPPAPPPEPLEEPSRPQTPIA
ncbi:hypothetical protein J1605_000651 [Eschrichtius robustus]|uniref:Uncharacterized protein n=1 Tax=Eschrichtius robustus TaxID=9764 RepID=A0AB34GNA0_ESCRO|nr:hypothetical protein J1605_000651 [Eschrichtius robustus]